MPYPRDTQVRVTGVSDTTISISLGPNHYVIDKEELSALMRGDVDDYESIKRNIATALALSGVNIEDDIAIKDAIEQRTFKSFR